jgi:hypothetical protein
MLPRAKDNGGESEVFRTEEFAKLIAWADAKLVPFLALGVQGDCI